MPNGVRLLSSLLLSTIACASAPPVEEGVARPVERVATSAPSAAVSAEPKMELVTNVLPGDLLFRPSGIIPPGADLYAIDGTLAAVDIRPNADMMGFEAYVYELSGNKFALVGAQPFDGQMTHIEGVEGKAGGRLVIVSLSPYGRGAMRTETPIRGGGRAQNVGDPMSIVFDKIAELNVPGCGSSPGSNKLLPMKRSGDVQEDGDAVLVEGLGCDEKRVLQVRADRKATPTFRELEPRQRLANGTKGVYLVGDRIERHAAGRFTVIAENVPPILNDKAGRASVAFVYELPDGSVIAHSGKQAFLWHDRKWVEALLPGHEPAASVLWDGQTLWATNSAGIYRFTPPGASAPTAIDTTALKDVKDEPSPGDSPALVMKPPGPQCKSNVVVLYGFTKVTPLDYDYPLTRKALKGHLELKGTRFAVTEDGGKRYFVGFPPSFQVAQELVKVVSAGVNGSKPQVVCAEPKVIREMNLDLATGEIK
jgi:hypothetical protein